MFEASSVGLWGGIIGCAIGGWRYLWYLDFNIKNPCRSEAIIHVENELDFLVRDFAISCVYSHSSDNLEFDCLDYLHPLLSRLDSKDEQTPA
jgi:hypothetical protein